jgi:hypothetical protein
MINKEVLDDLFNRLMNRFENEDQSESYIKDGSNLSFSDEEIIFMGQYNIAAFVKKYPKISIYYMKCLS